MSFLPLLFSQSNQNVRREWRGIMGVLFFLLHTTDNDENLWICFTVLSTMFRNVHVPSSLSDSLKVTVSQI